MELRRQQQNHLLIRALIVNSSMKMQQAHQFLERKASREGSHRSWFERQNSQCAPMKALMKGCEQNGCVSKTHGHLELRDNEKTAPMSRTHDSEISH